MGFNTYSPKCACRYDSPGKKGVFQIKSKIIMNQILMSYLFLHSSFSSFFPSSLHIVGNYQSPTTYMYYTLERRITTTTPICSFYYLNLSKFTANASTNIERFTFIPYHFALCMKKAQIENFCNFFSTTYLLTNETRQIIHSFMRLIISIPNKYTI